MTHRNPEWGHGLERRRVATERTLARFRGKAFDWSKGITCAHMARYHLRNLGHRPPGMPRFRSALGAKKALAAKGWGSVSDMLDSLVPRIAPAEMLLGDLAAVPGDAGLDAVFIYAGPGRVFGWREDEPNLVVLEVPLDQLSGAWRA